MMMNDVCTCAFKQELIRKLQTLRDDPSFYQRKSIEHLLGSSCGSGQEPPLCCMLAYLFQVAYCGDAHVITPEEARAILDPLIGNSTVS